MTGPLTIPLPVQVVLDDVGWWTPTDGSARGEPYRSGMPRPHVPADYAAIADLGRRLEMRPQAAMMLCDWDRDGLLRDVPGATWMGRNWDNPWRNHPHLDAAAQILGDEAEHLELVVHGLAHEWWEEGGMERAEWADRAGTMRPRHLLERHLDAYAAILQRNGLGALPPAFVPCAFCHAFGDGADGIQGLLAERGIRYVSTPWRSLRQERAPQLPSVAVECGVMVVDRGGGAPPWHEVAAAPPPDMAGPIVGLHWPNILHEDPDRSGEVVDAWVQHLEGVGRRPDRWLAPDTPRAWSQLAHARGTRVVETDGEIDFDFAAVDALQADVPLDRFVVKAPAGQVPRFAPEVTPLRVTRDTAAGTITVELQRQPG